MLMQIIALFIGAIILGGGVYYLCGEKSDPQEIKIYAITTAAGALVVIWALVKMIL